MIFKNKKAKAEKFAWALVAVAAVSILALALAAANGGGDNDNDDEECNAGAGFRCIPGDEDRACPPGFTCEQESGDDRDADEDGELKECELDGVDDGDDTDDGICAKPKSFCGDGVCDSTESADCIDCAPAPTCTPGIACSLASDGRCACSDDGVSPCPADPDCAPAPALDCTDVALPFAAPSCIACTSKQAGPFDACSDNDCWSSDGRTCV